MFLIMFFCSLKEKKITEGCNIFQLSSRKYFSLYEAPSLSVIHPLGLSLHFMKRKEKDSKPIVWICYICTHRHTHFQSKYKNTVCSKKKSLRGKYHMRNLPVEKQKIFRANPGWSTGDKTKPCKSQIEAGRRTCCFLFDKFLVLAHRNVVWFVTMAERGDLSIS